MAATDTRTQILDAALDEFWRTSYHAMNMNELSRAAGVNKATVYQHFASKEEIAISAILRGAERTRAYVFAGAFEVAHDPRERLKEIYQRLYFIHKSVFDADGKCRGCPFVNLGVELATSSEGVRDAVNVALESFVGFYETIVADLDEVAWRGGDRNDAASALASNTIAALVASKLENRPEAILDGKDRALAIIGD